MEKQDGKAIDKLTIYEEFDQGGVSVFFPEMKIIDQTVKAIVVIITLTLDCNATKLHIDLKSLQLLHFNKSNIIVK